MDSEITTTALTATSTIHEPMAWWYFFGMWIAVIICVLLVFWSLMDAYRRGRMGAHSILRFVWPIAGCTGTLLILPSLIIGEIALTTTYGAPLAYLGIAGTVITGCAMLAFFSRPSSDGGTFLSLTRSSGTTASSTNTSGRKRRTTGGVGVSAPLPRPERRKEITPLVGEVAPTQNETILESNDDIRTILQDDSGDGTMLVDQTIHQTQMSRPATTAQTVLDEPTLLDTTIVDELVSLDATVVDDPGDSIDPATSDTILNEPDDEPEMDALPLVSLQITGGETSRIVFTPDRTSFVVGRDPSVSNFAVSDARVSKQHFCIEPTEDAHVIIDLRSANGTFVNGKRITTATTLRPDDLIEFGRMQARFVADNR